MERVHEDTTDEELLDDVSYLWESQGPAGRQRGARAIIELLYRWEYLPSEFWDMDYNERKRIIEETAYEPAVATISVEANERGLDHELTF